jgi:hypothetical protein
MTAGETYTLDLISQDFDAYLRLEDPSGKQVAEDDDSGGNNHSRIYYTAPQTGTYRLIATTFLPTAEGRYRLRVLPGKVASVPEPGPADAGKLEGVLTRDLPTDPSRPGCFHRVLPFAMKAGETRTFVLSTPDFGAYLRLENSSGQNLVINGGPGKEARIVFTAPKADDYRVIVSSNNPGATGRYTLRILGFAAPTPTPPPGTPASVPGVPVVGGGGMVANVQSPGEQRFGDITLVREAAPWVNTNQFDAGHGYLEHRLTVRNHSATTAHRVTLRIPPERNNFQSGVFLSSLSRTVEVGPGTSVPVELFQPDLFLPSTNVAVVVDGKEFPGFSLNPQSRGTRSYTTGFNPQQLLTILAEGDLASQLDQNVARSAIGHVGPYPPGRTGSHGSRALFSPDGRASFLYNQVHYFLQAPKLAEPWDTHWLGFSSYDGIVLQAAELRAAPASVRDALWRYVECGGALVIAGSYPVPVPWQRRRAEWAGKGVVNSYYPGLGQCLVLPETAVKEWTPQQWQEITSAWDRSGKPWENLRSLPDAHRLFPVVENMSIPVRGLFILMLVFAIGIGPLNIYLLSRKKRRLWLLWTVPAISTVTCLAVLGYMLVAEGWRGQTRVQTLTVLDENTHRAATVGWVGYYTPMAPADGLHFSADTELTAQQAADPHVSRMQSLPRTLDWTDGEQHLASGWVTARVPAYFTVRKAGTSRERLNLHWEKDGSLSVVNLLGADVGRLWLADREGRVYTAESVPLNGQVTLHPTGETLAGKSDPAALRRLYGEDWLRHYDKLTAHPQDYLLPGCYIATLGATPFLEEGLQGARQHDSRSVVYGILREGTDEN